MSIKYLLLIFIIIITGCSKKQGAALFSTSVSNQPGQLITLNEGAYMGSVPMGNTLEYQFILYASGGLDLFNISASLSGDSTFTFAGGTYPGTGGTCNDKLTSGKSCYITINYLPTALTTNYMNLAFTYSDNKGTKSYDVDLEADSHPILTFQYGTRYDFGNKFIGTSTDLTIRITNTGKAPATNLTVGNLTLPYRFKGGTYPGTGGNCGTSVQVGAVCDIVINYSPSASGQHLQDITLNYLNVGNSEQNILNLSAWGFFPAVLSLSDSTPYNFGTKVASIDHDKTYTLTYVSGDVTATNIGITGLSAPFAFKGGVFPGTGGTCTTTLRTGSCTIVVSMNSSSSNTWSNNFTLQYLDGKTLQTFSRTIQGITRLKPIITITPSTTIDYGMVKTSTTANQTFTYTYTSGELSATNLGADDLALPFKYAGGSGFPGTGGTCTSTLSSGSCTIVLAYAPTVQSNLWQNTIKLSYDDNITRVQQTVLLKGSTEAKISFQTADVAFGSRVTNTTTSKSATLVFIGGIPATSLTPNTPGVPFSYSGSGYPGTVMGTCGNSLSSGICIIDFVYTPTDSNDHLYGYTLTYFDGFTNQTLNLSLTGKGVSPATLVVPNTNFGTTDTNSQVHQNIIITNSSLMNATSLTTNSLPTDFTFKGGTYPGAGGNCSTSINAGASCTLALTFNPQNSGSFNGNLVFNYFNGSSNVSSSGTLSGTAVNSNNLYISDYDTYSFGNKYLNTTTDKTFTLYHAAGGVAATSISPVALPSDYTFKGGTFPGSGGTCGATLTSGSSCTFVVTFSPLSSGTKNTTLTLNYFNGTSNLTVTRALTGLGLQQAVITISPKPYNFGNQPIGAVYENTFTVTAIGVSPPIVWTGDVLGSGFAYKGGSYPGTGGTCAAEYIGGPCTIVTVFSPTAVTNYSGTVRIRYWDLTGWTYATSELTGTGIDSAILSFGNSSYDFGKIIQSLSGEATLTITNSGTIAASSLSIASISAPFSYKGGNYPGTGGTCGTTLAVGTCTIVVKFTPSATGIVTFPLVLNYFNGNISTSTTLNLTGEGVAQAVLSISELDPYSFGSVVVGSGLDKTFTVTNGGSTTATSMSGNFTASMFTFKDGSYPGTGGTCGASLASYATCTLTLRFAPTSLGAKTTTFNLTYNDGLGSQTEFKTLNGTGITALSGASLLQMIPIKVIPSSSSSVFFQEALSVNGDKVKLNNGTAVSGTETLIIQKGKNKKYLTLLNDNVDISSDLSSWGLSKINIGDINSDAVDDFLISHFSPNASSVPNEEIFFTCYSGKDLSVIYNITVPNPTHLLLGLSSVTIPQDIDGDGHNEFITGLYEQKDDHLVLKDYIIFSSLTGLPIENYQL